MHDLYLKLTSILLTPSLSVLEYSVHVATPTRLRTVYPARILHILEGSRAHVISPAQFL